MAPSRTRISCTRTSRAGAKPKRNTRTAPTDARARTSPGNERHAPEIAGPARGGVQRGSSHPVLSSKALGQEHHVPLDPGPATEPPRSIGTGHGKTVQDAAVLRPCAATHLSVSSTPLASPPCTRRPTHGRGQRSTEPGSESITPWGKIGVACTPPRPEGRP